MTYILSISLTMLHTNALWAANLNVELVFRCLSKFVLLEMWLESVEFGE